MSADTDASGRLWVEAREKERHWWRVMGAVGGGCAVGWLCEDGDGEGRERES